MSNMEAPETFNKAVLEFLSEPNEFNDTLMLDSYRMSLMKSRYK